MRQCRRAARGGRTGVGEGEREEADMRSVKRLQAKNKQVTTESDRAGQCWLDHRAFSNNERNTRIECETNENENEHLIR